VAAHILTCWMTVPWMSVFAVTARMERPLGTARPPDIQVVVEGRGEKGHLRPRGIPKARLIGGAHSLSGGGS
jgi:hypothetical protein